MTRIITSFIICILCFDTFGQDFDSEITYLNKKELDYKDRNFLLGSGKYKIGDSYRPFTGIIYLHCSIKDVKDTLCNNCRYEYFKDSIYVSEEYTYYIGGRLDMTKTKYSDGSRKEKIYKAIKREDGSECRYCQYLEREWYKNGQKKSERFYGGGNLYYIGPEREWYENGQKHIEAYFNLKSGEREGKYQEWNEAGKLTHELHFKNGKKDGLCSWYNNGKLSTEQNYKEGEKHGICKWWDNNGKLEVEEIWEHGSFKYIK